MRNFEKIKQMTAEEMSLRMLTITKQICNHIDDCGECPFELIACGNANCIKQWLESEAEENECKKV